MSICIQSRKRVLFVLGFILAGTVPASPSTFFKKELLFETNKGQAAPEVQFLARTASYTLLLEHSNATLWFKNAPGHDAAAVSPLAIHFDRSNPSAVLSGLTPTLAKINYFSGSDARAWKRDISTYRQVQYGSLYAGINLLFYEHKGSIEFDFVVDPGADPSSVRLSFNSPGKLSIAKNGDLIIPVGAGELRLHLPAIFQTSDSKGGRTGDAAYVRGKYLIDGDGTVSLAMGPYDHSKTLVIDPVVTYSSYLGGTDDEGIFGIQRDREGNIYVSGETSSLNFPSRNSLQPNEGGNYDAFVSKFDPTGTHLIYSTYLGGSGYDHAVGLAVTESGSAYIAGVTTSRDFPTKHPLQAVLKGRQNAFVARLTPSGSDLLFATYLGGSDVDTAQDMTIDDQANIYITGATNSSDFPITPGAFQTVCDGPHGFGPGFCNSDAFVTKLAPNGSKLLYSTFLGGTSGDSAFGIAVDETGAAYITGQSESTDFPLFHPFQPDLAGSANAFVSKLSPTGNKLEFSTYLGGSGPDGGTGIAVDFDGAVYVTGTTSSSNFPLVKPFQAVNRGGYSDCYVAELSREGDRLLRSTYFGGKGWDFPFRLGVDIFGSVSVIGFTGSPDLPLAHPVQRHFGGGNTDAFVLKLLPESFTPLYSTYLGGSGDEYGYGIYSEPLGAVWLGGSTSSRDFLTRRSFQSTYAGGLFDAFLTRLELTIPDYFRILEDLITGEETSKQTELSKQLSTAQKVFLTNDREGSVGELPRLDALIKNAAAGNDSASLRTGRALAASRRIQEILNRFR